MLAPHRERTLRRMQGEQIVLSLQDGTDLNFAEHPGCVGLGLIAKNRRSPAKAKGGTAKSSGSAGGKQRPQGRPEHQGGQLPAGEVYPDGTLGLHMHWTLAVNAAGIPLGCRRSSSMPRTARRSAASRCGSARR